MLAVITASIEAEQIRQHGEAERPPGVYDIFQGPADPLFDRADRASRVVQAPSLVEFLRDVIEEGAARILAQEAVRREVHPIGLLPTPNPVYPITELPRERVADTQEKEGPK